MSGVQRMTKDHVQTAYMRPRTESDRGAFYAACSGNESWTNGDNPGCRSVDMLMGGADQ